MGTTQASVCGTGFATPVPMCISIQRHKALWGQWRVAVQNPATLAGFAPRLVHLALGHPELTTLGLEAVTVLCVMHPRERRWKCIKAVFLAEMGQTNACLRLVHALHQQAQGRHGQPLNGPETACLTEALERTGHLTAPWSG